MAHTGLLRHSIAARMAVGSLWKWCLVIAGLSIQGDEDA